jgi:hypothetical protein
MSRSRAGLPGIAFVDFLSNVLLLFMVFFVLSFVLIQPKRSQPSIDTLGTYAVVVTWPSGDDDVDTYVRDPAGEIAYFANAEAGLMHLEHDDLGRTGDTKSAAGRKVTVDDNAERVILRGTLSGEYVVNVHMYRKLSSGPVRVRLRLYGLRGPDRELLAARSSLASSGAERTAFRFSLDAAGRLTGTNHLQTRLVGTAGLRSGGAGRAGPAPLEDRAAARSGG